MAQYYTDFSEYPTGVAPEDWTRRFAADFNWEVQNDAGADGGKILAGLSGSSGARNGFSWDAIDSDPTRATAEVFFRARFSTSDSEILALTRANTDANGSASAYRHGARPSQSSTSLGKYVIGSFTEIKRLDKTYTLNAWYNVKAQVIGSDNRVKVWQSDTVEPAAWDIDEVDTSLSDAGWVGLFRFASAPVEIDVFGVGTDGDPAPTSAVGPPTGTDNLAAQNLKAQASTTTAPLTQAHQLAPASLQAATATTSATLAQVHTLAPVSLISASNTTTGVLAQGHTLAPTNLTSTTTTNTPALAQVHSLTGSDLASQSSTTNTSLSDQSTVDNLTASNLQAASTTNTPELTQAHNLTASDTASQTTTTSPQLAQVHTLNPASLTANTSTTTATLQSIAGQDTLTGTDLTASTGTTTGTLAQVHVLTPQSLAAGTSTTTASITQVHGLAASNVISITSTTSPTLRNASVVLTTPITNTKATAIQATYKATAVQAQRKAVTIQADYKVGVA